MAAASDYTEKNTLNAMLRGEPFPLATRLFVGLHTADPTDAGGGEVTVEQWPSYERIDAAGGGAVQTGWSEPAPDAEGGHTSKNLKQVVFPGMDGDEQITVTHWALYDAATGGNMICHAELKTPRDLQAGDVFVFDRNAIEISQR